MNNKILLSLATLESYILKENFKGYDPYDGLMSPIFKLPILRNNKLIRFGFQQTFRRIPFNIRPLLGIKKGLNPVTLGLCIESFTYLSIIFKEKQKFYLDNIDWCLKELIKLQSKGYSGSCWGYDFDWEARYAKINAFVPTIVATGIITNSLFESYRILKNEKLIELCKSATKFVLNDLNKTENEQGICYSYSPVDKQKVLNAAIKGARLLSQVYSITKEEKLKSEAEKVINYVFSAQNNDGSWPYSIGDARKWSDNFHTAYVLDSLKSYMDNIPDKKYEDNYKKGLSFYVNNFFENRVIPKYYNNKTYPIDATSISQSIITLTKNNELKLAENVLEWAISNMYDEKGYFYYQKTKYYTHKTSFMRWSNAWMFNAITYFIYKSNNE
jgi:hypothetical protein